MLEKGKLFPGLSFFLPGTSERHPSHLRGQGKQTPDSNFLVTDSNPSFLPDSNSSLIYANKLHSPVAQNNTGTLAIYGASEYLFSVSCLIISEFIKSKRVFKIFTQGFVFLLKHYLYIQKSTQISVQLLEFLQSDHIQIKLQNISSTLEAFRALVKCQSNHCSDFQ